MVAWGHQTRYSRRVLGRFADLRERDVANVARERRTPERGKARAGRIGQFLVSRGSLTQEQLRAALDESGSRRLDEVLLSKNLISGEELARAVAGATGFEYVFLSEDSVDSAVVTLLGEKVLRKYGALPLRLENGRLVVALSDPTDVLALDDLKSLAGYPIRPVVATAESVRRLQDRAFGLEEDVQEILEAEEGASVKPFVDDSVSVSREDEGAPVVRLVNSIIRRALSEGASDIHVEPRAEELVVRYRVDGVLKRGTSAPLSLKNSLTSRLKILGDLDISERCLPSTSRS